MHTCPPPKRKLNDWFARYSSVDGDANAEPTDGTYGHLLLEQTGDHSDILPDLIPYFESAHLDARIYFHQAIGIDLHPDSASGAAPIQYPHCLPSDSKRGLFGEVLAGLVAECFDFVGGHKWSMPVFLFRNHDDAERYLFNLVRDPTSAREIYGRHGSDFIGVALAADKTVERIIVGEAKWRTRLSQSIVDTMMLGDKIADPADPETKVHNGKGVWSKVSSDIHVPHGFRQLVRILSENDPEAFGSTILSLEKLLLANSTSAVERTDLVLIAGNPERTRESRTSYIDWQEAPEEYKRDNDLQVVEVIFKEGHDLIDALYDALWLPGGAHAAS